MESVNKTHNHSKKCKKDNHVDFGIVMCISHMHPMLIKAVWCVTGVEIFCRKTSAAVDDVKALSNG